MLGTPARIHRGSQSWAYQTHSHISICNTTIIWYIHHMETVLVAVLFRFTSWQASAKGCCFI